MIWQRFGLPPGYLWTVLTQFLFGVFSLWSSISVLYLTVWQVQSIRSKIYTLTWAHLQVNNIFPYYYEWGLSKTKIFLENIAFIFPENILTSTAFIVETCSCSNNKHLNYYAYIMLSIKHQLIEVLSEVSPVSISRCSNLVFLKLFKWQSLKSILFLWEMLFYVSLVLWYVQLLINSADAALYGDL